MKGYVTMVVPEDRIKVPIKGTVEGPRLFPTFGKLIEEVTYKPGYELVLEVREQRAIDGVLLFPDDQMYGNLRMKCYIPDSRKFPYEDTLIQVQYAIMPYIEDRPREFQIHYLKELLYNFERHELDEWFRINGQLVNDPHDPGE